MRRLLASIFAAVSLLTVTAVTADARGAVPPAVTPAPLNPLCSLAAGHHAYDVACYRPHVRFAAPSSRRPA